MKDADTDTYSICPWMDLSVVQPGRNLSLYHPANKEHNNLASVLPRILDDESLEKFLLDLTMENI